MIDVNDAEQRVLGSLGQCGTEVVPVELACGRVLRRPVRADRALPPFDRAMMDGIAMASAAAGADRLRIEGVQLAGMEPGVLAKPATGCWRVMTGAALPVGADTVVPVEELSLEEDHATLSEPELVEPRRFVHREGSDRTKDEILLRPGQRLGAPQVAVLAAVGLAEIEVAAPRVALLSTGDELVPPGRPVEPWQIRPSSTYAMEAALRARGCADVRRRHLPDDRARMLETLPEILAAADLVVLSGGVSKGSHDFVPSVLEELGVEPVFHRVRQRPGKPLWFGLRTGGRPVFGLPGNPVSTLVCFRRYVIPALQRMLGAEDEPAESAVLAEAVRTPPALALFCPVTLDSEDGVLRATPTPSNTSGDFAALGDSDGFVELPAPGPPEAGGTVRLFRW